MAELRGRTIVHLRVQGSSGVVPEQKTTRDNSTSKLEHGSSMGYHADI